MRPTISQLRTWVPEALATSGTQLAERNRGFDDAIHRMGSLVETMQEHWQGDAATAASARSLSESLEASHIATAVLAAADAYIDAAAMLGPAARTVLDIVDDATRNHGMTVADDGRVSAPTASSGDSEADMLLQSQLNETANTFASRLSAALDTVGQLDAAAAAALAKAIEAIGQLRQSPTGGALGSRVQDILNGNAFLPEDPKELNDFWESLSPAEKDGLAAWDPSIGNRDGLPAVDKDHYNREYLDTLKTKAQSDVDRLDGGHPDWARGENIPEPPSSGLPDEDDQQRIREYEDWKEDFVNSGGEAAVTNLAGYDAVADQMNQGGEPPKYLLNIDDGGRAAIALNNPDSAQNVATYVPGTGSELPKIGEGVQRSERMLETAMRTQEQAIAEGRAVAPGPTSVIAWYGYNAPPEIPDAGSDSYADAGAPRLDSFLDGQRAAHDGPPAHSVVIGHSYGSTVIGTAATEGGSLNADELVFVGSPGVNAERVTDLSLDGVPADQMGNRVSATAAFWDPVPKIGDIAGDVVHGFSPADPDFGAQVFESKPGLPSVDVAVHGEYWDRGNPSLDSMGRIIAGVDAIQ